MYEEPEREDSLRMELEKQMPKIKNNNDGEKRGDLFVHKIKIFAVESG